MQLSELDKVYEYLQEVVISVPMTFLLSIMVP